VELKNTDEILEELAFLADRMRKFQYNISAAKSKISDNHLRVMVDKFRAWESEVFLKEEQAFLELRGNQLD